MTSPRAWFSYGLKLKAETEADYTAALASLQARVNAALISAARTAGRNCRSAAEAASHLGEEQISMITTPYRHEAAVLRDEHKAASALIQAGLHQLAPVCALKKSKSSLLWQQFEARMYAGIAHETGLHPAHFAFVQADFLRLHAERHGVKANVAKIANSARSRDITIDRVQVSVWLDSKLDLRVLEYLPSFSAAEYDSICAEHGVPTTFTQRKGVPAR